MGTPATGRQIDLGLIDVTRIGDHGLCHEHWGVMDALAMMQQLGAVPEGPPAYADLGPAIRERLLPHEPGCHRPVPPVVVVAAFAVGAPPCRLWPASRWRPS
jgi:hypothetical protein